MKHYIHFATLALCFALAAVSCSKKETEQGCSVYYKSVSNITASMVFVSETPSWHGAKPSDFAIDAIYLDGQPCESEAFSINPSTGAITVQFADESELGTYVLDISCMADGQKYVFPAAFTIVNSPSELEYRWSSMEVELGDGFRSGIPSATGSKKDLQFAISEVQPATDKISIDAATGEIIVAEDHGFAVGEEYVVSVKVSNAYGSKTFDKVLTLSVVDEVTPIVPATFSYADKSVFRATALSLQPAEGLVGSYLKFYFDVLPEALEGYLKIDQKSGEVSLAAGNDAPLGEYDITVCAENTKSLATASFQLVIKENVYFFSKIVYGNNLGIDAESNANQFLFSTADSLAAARLTPTTDAREGVELQWSVKMLKNCGGTAIDAATGEITPSGFKANNVGLVMVTATAGKGEEGETSVSVPVFFSFLQINEGVFVRYAPFVMQANPQRGGVFNAPEVKGVKPVSNFQMDWRRNFEYFNFNGPASHVSGSINKDYKDRFIYKMWEQYYTSISTAINAGAKLPMSAWDPKAQPGMSLGYISKDNLAVVVNPEKWKYDGAYANGALNAQATYVTDGCSDNNKISSGTQIFPIWIWFDERF